MAKYDFSMSPTYDYDPQEQRYTLTGGSEGGAPSTSSLLGRAVSQSLAGMPQQAYNPMYTYNPSNQQFTATGADFVPKVVTPSESSMGSESYARGGVTGSPENYGRHGDSMLVHMNPQEVRGLQALARMNGKSMTINPQTGYPEAFNLRALLPTILGAGLAATGIGAPAAALLVGGGTTAATGSLKKGLMAGLGAFGGANIASGFTAAGSGAGATAGSQGLAGATMPGGAPAAVGETVGLAGNVPPATSLPTPASAPFTANPAEAAINRLSATPPTPNTLVGVPSTPPSIPSVGAPGAVEPSYMESLGRTKTGFQNIMSGSPEAKTAFMESVGGKSGLAQDVGMAALSTASLTPPPKVPTGSPSYIREYDFQWNPVTGAYEQGGSSEATYFSPTFTPGKITKVAGGGLMSLAQGGSYDDEAGRDGMAAGGLTAFKRGGRPDSRKLVGEDPYSFMGKDDTMLSTTERNFAAGGSPRFLSGGGDGMSDSIPAVIGDRQPARLADGEFVIPADVVSHIGNGSSKAGAQKLYGMMDKVRQQRTGKKKQAPAIKAEKYMPV